MVHFVGLPTRLGSCYEMKEAFPPSTILYGVYHDHSPWPREENNTHDIESSVNNNGSHFILN